MHRSFAAPVFIFLALLLWGLAALFAWAGLGNTWYGWVSQDWPVAEGRIVASTVEVERINSKFSNTHDAQPRGQTLRYHPVIEYQWQVDGGLYERDRRNFSAAVAGEETRESAEAIIAPYGVGERVDIHYDPGQPSRGILEPGPHWDGLGVTLVVAIVLAGFALLFSVLGYRKIRA